MKSNKTKIKFRSNKKTKKQQCGGLGGGCLDPQRRGKPKRAPRKSRMLPEPKPELKPEPKRSFKKKK